MSVNSMIKAALGDIAPVYPDNYTGNDPKYFVFNYSTTGGDFSDDQAQYDICLVQVHYYCPLSINTVELRKKVKHKLSSAGFTWPDCTNASDDEYQHLVFECQLAEVIDYSEF